jgi:tartrate-resistant acid phosphatase type 5
MKHYIYLFVLLISIQITNAQKEGQKTLKDSENFIVIGDFGRFGEYNQKEVANQMAKTAIEIDLDFVVSVGDNFYPYGVQSTQDPHFEKSFENVYHHFDLQCDWYLGLGNHDYSGNIQAQIDYSNISRRWHMPSQYFEQIIELKGGKKLQLIFIDTNPFIKSYYENNDEKGRNVKKQDTIAQKKWLIETLNKKDASINWKIVVGHHPMYSGGKRLKSQDTKDIENLLTPIFNEYKVDAYLCGHEHDLQIIKSKNCYTTQFLSGAGSEVRPTGNREGTIYAISLPGFMTFSVNTEKMLVHLINESGTVLYTHEINKK